MSTELESDDSLRGRAIAEYGSPERFEADRRDPNRLAHFLVRATGEELEIAARRCGVERRVYDRSVAPSRGTLIPARGSIRVRFAGGPVGAYCEAHVVIDGRRCAVSLCKLDPLAVAAHAIAIAINRDSLLCAVALDDGIVYEISNPTTAAIRLDLDLRETVNVVATVVAVRGEPGIDEVAIEVGSTWRRKHEDGASGYRVEVANVDSCVTYKVAGDPHPYTVTLRCFRGAFEPVTASTRREPVTPESDCALVTRVLAALGTDDADVRDSWMRHSGAALDKVIADHPTLRYAGFEGRRGVPARAAEARNAALDRAVGAAPPRNPHRPGTTSHLAWEASRFPGAGAAYAGPAGPGRVRVYAEADAGVREALRAHLAGLGLAGTVVEVEAYPTLLGPALAPLRALAEAVHDALGAIYAAEMPRRTATGVYVLDVLSAADSIRERNRRIVALIAEHAPPRWALDGFARRRGPGWEKLLRYLAAEVEIANNRAEPFPLEPFPVREQDADWRLTGCAGCGERDNVGVGFDNRWYCCTCADAKHDPAEEARMVREIVQRLGAAPRVTVEVEFVETIEDLDGDRAWPDLWRRYIAGPMGAR